MIIGVTGTDGSGKDTVGRLLLEKLGWPHYSLSDEIRGIARERGLGLSKDILGDLANELRQAHGPSYLAERIVERASGNFVVTSVRNPLECEPFRATGKFLLIAVDAPIHIRYDRTAGRDRAGEANWTIEDFRHHEEVVEMAGGEFGQQLRKMLEIADIKIINDGTIAELEEKVDKIVMEVKNVSSVYVG
ncbi:MAG: AAA family ATPase [Patescibacteria group bacterium]|jgi:dephospho-CoA kinase